jgi:SWIM zinc finger
MNFDYKYQGRSGFSETHEGARLALATNSLREATYFRGILRDPLLAREGFGALYDVVQSDFKWRPKERVAYQLWLEQRDRDFVRNFSQHQGVAQHKMLTLRERLAQLDGARRNRRVHFTAARQRYMRFAALSESEAYRVLDPVITVHPDEMSFEAFSRDQSSYARLRLGYELFSNISDTACGTTNIDFSAALHDHLDRMRSYRETVFELGAGGFASKQLQPDLGAPVAYEKRIDLPDGWMEGFLNVHGLMSMGLTKLQLAPIDALNVVKFLLAHRTQASPRAMRFELSPGLPIRIVLEPWNVSFWCSPLSVYTGTVAQSIRIWGRDRLRTLLRILPICTSLNVHLVGSGLPSVWVAELGSHASFTLALSGWTDNDWVEGEGKFDLLTRRAHVSAQELQAVFEMLRALRVASFEDLGARLTMLEEKVKSAVSLLAQDGRAMFDLSSQMPRYRDLFTTAFDANQALKAAVRVEKQSPEAALAKALMDLGDISIIARRPFEAGYKLSGNCADVPGLAARVRPALHVGGDTEIISASCTCAKMQKDGLSKGPCAHVLALRLAHMARLQSASA